MAAMLKKTTAPVAGRARSTVVCSALPQGQGRRAVLLSTLMIPAVAFAPKALALIPVSRARRGSA